MGWVWWCPGGREGHLASEDNLSYTEGPYFKEKQEEYGSEVWLSGKGLAQNTKSPESQSQHCKKS